jgi:aryl-alcohol dehydrogenase-like predicted oxidoreductase
VITVIAGSRRPATIRDSAAAAALQLSSTDVEQLTAETSFDHS